MLFMVIERFRPGCAPEIYRRFHEKGRMAPEDVQYVNSWVDLEFRQCFQVMDAPSEELLQRWIANWTDLIAFEIVPVRTSAQASAIMATQA